MQEPSWQNRQKGFVLLTSLVSFAFLLSILLFAVLPDGQVSAQVHEKESDTTFPVEPLLGSETIEGGIIPEEETQSQKYVIVLLDKMVVELHSTSTTEILPIISIGKPGSYYETPGGNYINDYKVPLHFSSIGHVYMPNSVHIFGNFFIHGIPYYPNGLPVNTDYSGGCIRLSNEDSKKVYDFVEKGTPIILTQTDLPESSRRSLNASDMTRLMVATISLEFLNQDNPVYYAGSKTTRKALIKNLFSGDDNVAPFFAKQLGNDTFIDYMNKKAKAIGMVNTTFSTLTDAATTTEADSELFYNYLSTYKPYLFSSTTLGN